MHDKFPNSNHNAYSKPIFRFSFPIFLSSVILLILNWADIIIIASITSNYLMLGIYSVVVNSINTLSVLLVPILTTVFPLLSARYGVQHPEGISNILKNTSRYVAYVVFPACLGLVAIAPTALNFLYGPSYTSGAMSLAILSIATIFSSFYLLFTTTLTAIGRTDNILKINAISAIFSVTLLVIIVPFFDIIGAALVRLAVQSMSFLLALYILRKEIKMKLDKEAVYKSAIASTATIPLLVLAEQILSTKIPITNVIIIELLTAVCVYLLSLHFLNALNRQDFDLLRQALPKSLTKYLNFIEKIIVKKSEIKGTF